MCDNLLNGILFEENFKINEVGDLIPAWGFVTTDPISCNFESYYTFTAQFGSVNVAFYDNELNFITSYYYSYSDVTFDTPQSASYLKITSENVEDGYLYWVLCEYPKVDTNVYPNFTITYKHKRVDIFVEGNEVENRYIAGTPDLFSLSYISDLKDKGQTIMTTEAQLNIYEDDYFNIDDLKTMGEMDIKIKYYKNDVLMWTGFVLPDFFETDISSNSIMSMTATDRIGVLKNMDYQGVRTSPRGIIEEALSKTGLGLTMLTMVDSYYFSESTVVTERFNGMNWYEVLTSVLNTFNLKVVQYENKWNVVNKYLLEKSIAQKNITIGALDVSGIREVKPAASEVSMKMEFGGSKKYPKNWNFKKINFDTVFQDWIIQLGAVNTRQVIGYDVVGSVQNARFGAETNVNSLWIRSPKIPALDGGTNVLIFPHITSSWSKMKILAGTNSKLDVRLNFTSASNIALLLYVRVKVGSNYFVYGKDGELELGGTESSPSARINPLVAKAAERNGFGAVQTLWNFEIDLKKTPLGIDEDVDADIEFQYIIMRGRSSTSPVTETDYFINSAELVLLSDEVEGKGLIFKIKQETEKFSKKRDEQLIHLSDKISVGVNGFFYNYKYDDTSIVDLSSEFILKHPLSEQSKMFSKARNFLKVSGDIEVNPLAHYICGDKKYILVGGKSRRLDASVELEEIVEDSEINKIEYIYTYF